MLNDNWFDMKISIITATYNSGATLRDTFESVLRQGYKDYEYIIVDGASKDNTLDIVREYEPKFEGRMHWKSEKDKGLYDAMNKGISRATGDVVGILNSDDFYTSDDILSTVADSFNENSGLDAVYGDVHYVDEHDTSKLVRYYSSRPFRRSWMRMGFMPAHPSFYCKKSTYQKYKLDGNAIDGFKGNPDCAYFNTTYKIAADYENLLRMIFVHNISTLYIPKDFVTMRTGGASSSGAASHKQINKDQVRALKENGVYSNYFLLSLRYIYKVGELIKAKFSRPRI